MNGAERRKEAKARAAALAKRRTRSGLRRKPLADSLGVARQTLWRWESGESVPSLAQVQAWEAAIAKGEARRASEAAIARAAR